MTEHPQMTIARLTAELDWLKRSIFGSADYHPSLIVGQFAEMAQTTNEARKHAIARAEAAEALLARAYEAGRDDAAGGLDRDVADREADANRFRGGSNPHHYRMNLAQAVKYHAEQIRALPVPSPADLAARLGGQSEYENKVAQMKKDFPNGV